MVYYFQGERFMTHPAVYEPAEDSALLAENLAVKEGDKVLDLGTGTGIQAIVASKKARKVLAVDINPEALKLAGENAAANKAENIEFRISDLFSGVRTEEKFDLVIFNPPYVPSDEEDMHGRSWAGGKDGREVIERFISEAAEHLKEGGRIQILVSSLNDVDHVKKQFAKIGLEANIVAKEKLWFEELYVLLGTR